MRSLLLICCLLFMTSALERRTKWLRGNYYEWWCDTFVWYSFDDDHFCKFSTEGHLGNSTTYFYYYISNDTIYLKVLPFKYQKGAGKYWNADDTVLIRNDTTLYEPHFRWEFSRRS